MPRNGSGTMTAQAAYPPAAGSTISLADYKALIDDIVAELTDSLSRTGKGGMTNPLKLADGTPAAPSVAFTNEAGTGLYKPAGVSELRAAVLGTLVAKLTAAGLDVTGTLTSSGKATLASLESTGAAALPGGVTGGLVVTGDLAASGALGVTGLSTLTGGIAGAVTDGATTELSANKIRVKDAGITRAKLAAVGQQISGSGGGIVSDTGWADIAGLTVTLTTTGRPVMVFLQPDGSGNAGYIGAGSGNASVPTAYINVCRAGSPIAIWEYGPATGSASVYTTPCGLIQMLDAPTAGTHTYKIQAKVLTAGTHSAYIQNCKLVAFEL